MITGRFIHSTGVDRSCQQDLVFAARPFGSVADLNTQLARWIAEVAHARPVPDRREQRVADALAEEQPRLLPLPEHPFRGDLLRAVSSGKTPYIRFDGNDYSIPHPLVRRPLTLVAAEHVVRLLDGTTEVARHARSYDRAGIPTGCSSAARGGGGGQDSAVGA